MTRERIDTRPTIKLKVRGHIHTLVAQDDTANKIYPGAYLGHNGFVLQKIEKIITSTL